MINNFPKKNTNFSNHLLISTDKKPNANWMKDWMEQADSFKNNPEALKLIQNDIEGFLEYADNIEGK